MSKHEIKVNVSILDYFKMMTNFDNESEEYRKITEIEFESKLKDALDTKKIIWTKNN